MARQDDVQSDGQWVTPEEAAEHYANHILRFATELANGMISEGVPTAQAVQVLSDAIGAALASFLVGTGVSHEAAAQMIEVHARTIRAIGTAGGTRRDDGGLGGAS